MSRIISHPYIMSAFKRKFAFSAGSGFLQFGVATGYMLALAAILGPADFGLIGFQLSIIAIAKAVTVSAFQDTILRESLLTYSLFRSYLLWSSFFGVFSVIIGSLCFLLFSDGNIGLIIILALAILANSFVAVPSGILVKLGDFRRLFVGDLLSFFISYVGVGLPLMFLTRNLELLLIPIALTPILKYFVLVNSKSIKQVEKKYSCRQLHFRDFFKTSLSRVLHVSSAHIDKITIGLMLGPIALGLYRLAFQIVTIPTVIFARTIEKFLISELSSSFKDQKIRTPRKFIFAVLILTVIVFVLMLVLYIKRQYMMTIVLSPDWSPAFNYFLLLMPLLVVKPVLKLVELLFRTRHKEIDYLVFSSVQFFVVVSFAIVGCLFGELYVSALMSFAYLLVTIFGFVLLDMRGTVSFRTGS